MKSVQLREDGLDPSEVGQSLEALLKEDYRDVPLRAGQFTHWALGAHAIPDAPFIELGREAVARFAYESQFYVKRQPSLKRFSDEILAFVGSLHEAPANSGGSVTVGGTESNMLAMKAARDWARETLPHIERPEVVMSRAAHPSFVKAALYLNVEAVRVPTAGDWRADPKAIEAAITSNTIMIVGSAPTYPHGVIDPIDALSNIAAARGLWLHVDSCVGGIIGPFLREIDDRIPPFGFEFEGVTSLSADFHKHGYSPEGVSTITYRDQDLLRYQEFVFDDWPNGMHVAPVVVGSRPAGPLAGAWAIAQALGVSGYREMAQRIHHLRCKLVDGIRGTPGLDVFGDPRVTMFGYGSEEIDPFAIGDALTDMGWNVHRMQEPRGLHLIVDPLGDDAVVEDYLRDLDRAVTRVRSGEFDAADDDVSYG